MCVCVERNDKGRKKRGLSFHQMQKRLHIGAKNSKVFQAEVKMQSLKENVLANKNPVNYLQYVDKV